VALGCYTWEQIYSTPHALISTQTATNGANAATFGTLIYDAVSLKKHRQEAYTEIFRNIYGDLFGLSAYDAVNLGNNTNVYYKMEDGVEVHTFEMYVCIKDDGSGTAPIDEITGYHDVDWYVTTGNASEGTGAVKITTEVGSQVTPSQVAGRFWRDMIIEHADLSGNIDFNPVSNPGEEDVFQFLMTEETRTSEGRPIFTTPGSAIREKMMQMNFSSMLVNVLNHHNVNESSSVKRNWTMLTGTQTTSATRSMFGAVGTMTAMPHTVGHKLTSTSAGTRFQTNHHHKATGRINLQFEQNTVSADDGDFTVDGVPTVAGSFGELVEVNIPIKSSNYGNGGPNDDTYTLFLRANLDLTFDVDGVGNDANTGSVFYGQTTGKMTELMFGIHVKPIAATTIEEMRDAAVRARQAYETTKMERDVIHGYREEIKGHLDRFTDLKTKLEATDTSFNSMAEHGTGYFGEFDNHYGALGTNHSNINDHYNYATVDVNDAATYSNETDAAYSSTVANAKAALAEEAATDSTAERVAADNEMNNRFDDGDPNHAKLNATNALAELIGLMKDMEKALVLGGSANGTNVVSALTISSGGSGYGADTTIEISAPPDNEAATNPTASIDEDGKVNDVIIGTNGWGYFNHTPTVTVTNPADHTGETAVITAIVSGGKVTNYTIVNPGSGYTAESLPTLILNTDFDQEPDAVHATVKSFELEGGEIVSITLDNMGSRYDPAHLPTISINDTGDGSGADYTATVTTDYADVYRMPTATLQSSDAFHYVHSSLTTNIDNCDTMTSTIAGWKTAIQAAVDAGSVENYDDDVNAIDAKTAELATLKAELEAIRTELDAVGGANGTLRGNSSGSDWTHSDTMFTDATPEYEEMEPWFDKMDRLFDARDLILTRTGTADTMVTTDGNNIHDALNAVGTGVRDSISSKGDIDLDDLDAVVAFTSITL